MFLGKRPDKAVVERSLNGAAHNFIEKPAKLHELRTAIEVTLYRSDADRQLRSQERWFVSALQSISDAVIDLDAGGNIAFMNPAAEQLTGVSLEAGVGRPIREIVQAHGSPGPNSSLASVLEPLAVSPQQIRPKASVRRDDNADVAATHVFDSDALLQPVMVFSEFDEHRGANDTREAPNRLDGLANATASVAHEINNPLAVVLANSTVGQEELSAILSELESGAVPSAACLAALRGLVEMQEETTIAADRISRILNDLKVFGHEDAQAPCSKVDRAVRWALRTTAHELNQRAHVVIEIGDVPEVRLEEKRLAQVLVNVLLNVTHAIPTNTQQTKEVRISARQANDANEVVIEVADTGTGMPPDVLARAFEPFFSTKASSAGAGLGLPICQGIVRSVGGSIVVESIVGLGTKVAVTLPAVEERVNANKSEPPSTMHRHARILVVDDEPLLLRVIRRALKGNEIVCVETARAALHLLRDGQLFDIILCDVVMPQMNGFQLYEALLQSQPEEAHKLVFLDGGAINEQLAVALATTSNHKLNKPFKAEELRSLVRRFIADSNRRPLTAFVEHEPVATAPKKARRTASAKR